MQPNASFWSSKTGKTGLPLLGVGAAAYLISQEVGGRRARIVKCFCCLGRGLVLGRLIWGGWRARQLTLPQVLIFHYETIVVASVFGVAYVGIKKLGGGVAAALDERAKVRSAACRIRLHGAWAPASPPVPPL